MNTYRSLNTRCEADDAVCYSFAAFLVFSLTVALPVASIFESGYSTHEISKSKDADFFYTGSLSLPTQQLADVPVQEDDMEK